MSKPDAWMPLWIGAYLADTMHLSRDEHGGYLLLLMAYWRNQGPLPDDDRRLAAICRASADEWPMLRAVLEQFFCIAQGVWQHKRADEEIASADARSIASKAKAKAAAAARWGKGDKTSVTDPPSNAPSTAYAVPGQCPTPSPIYTSSLRSDVGARTPPTPPPMAVDAKRPSRTSVPAKPKERAAKTCPETFVVTDEMEDWARRECPGVNVARETAKFRNHEFAKAKTNWRGTWENWLYKASEDSRPAARRPDNRPLSAAERGDVFMQTLRTGRVAGHSEVIDVEPSNGPFPAIPISRDVGF